MRAFFHPRPTRELLGSAPLHVIVRDFPETLEEIRDWGVLPHEMGERTAEEIDPEGRLLDTLQALTAWRPGPADA
jgi:hypothetical protein